MQPLHYDLQNPAAKDNSVMHAAMAPSNLDAAMTMRFATSGCKPASLDAHGNTKRQQSCGRYTAICKQRFRKRKESRTHEQPLVAEHRGGTDSRPVRPQPHPPHARGTFHRRPEPLYPKKTRFPAPAFPQNEAHATSMQPLQCVLQHQVPNPHLSTQMATQNDNNHAAITLRSATRVSTHTPPFIEYSLTHLLVMRCQLSHHHSLSIVSHFSSWCDVNSHTTIHWI